MQCSNLHGLERKQAIPWVAPKTITISLFLSWEVTQQWLWEWLQEHNLQFLVSNNRGRSSKGKHNTEPVQKYCISGAYTTGLATSTFVGSHQRTGTRGQRATAQKQSFWTHMHIPTCTGYSRLAASVLWLPRWWVHGSTWLLSRPLEGLHSSLLAGSDFLPTGSTAPGGRGFPRRCHASLDPLVLLCNDWCSHNT